MLKKFLKLKGVTKLSKNQQKMVHGKGNCNSCYSNNGGAFNSGDPSCAGCPKPMML